jgi:hypothetical protein
MKIGPLPDAVEPDFQCVTTHWIRGLTALLRTGTRNPGFIAFQLARRTLTVCEGSDVT